MNIKRRDERQGVSQKYKGPSPNLGGCLHTGVTEEVQAPKGAEGEH